VVAPKSTKAVPPAKFTQNIQANMIAPTLSEMKLRADFIGSLPPLSNINNSQKFGSFVLSKVKKCICIAKSFYGDWEKLMRKALAASLLILAATTSAAIAAPVLWGIDTSDPAVAEIRTAADRIDGAFAALQGGVLDLVISPVVPAPKGDFAPACSSAVWPDIDASCLATSHGGPAPHVRMITIGYLPGENTTVLVHIPRAGTAQR
jgi:hypothetical protein